MNPACCKLNFLKLDWHSGFIFLFSLFETFSFLIVSRKTNHILQNWDTYFKVLSGSSELHKLSCHNVVIYKQHELWVFIPVRYWK